MTTTNYPPEFTDLQREFVVTIMHRLTEESWAFTDELDLLLDALQEHFCEVGVMLPDPRPNKEGLDEWWVTDKHMQFAREYLAMRITVKPDDDVTWQRAHDAVVELTLKIFPGIGVPLVKIRAEQDAIAAEIKHYNEIAMRLWREQPDKILGRPRDKDVYGFRDQAFEYNKFSCLVSMEFETPSAEDPEYLTYVVEFVSGTDEIVEAYCR